MALPKLTKTKYPGIKYYKDKIKGKVFVAIVNVNNKRYRKIVGYENDEYRTNETIALLKKEKMKEEILNEIYVSSSNEYNLNTLWDIYIESVKPTYAIKTIKNKESVYNVYFKNHFGNLKLNTIKNLHIQKFANELLKSKAPKTVQNIISDLATIFEFGKKHKFVKVNPANDIELPKYDNTRVFPLTEEESKRLFNTIINYDEILYRGIFTFLLHGRRKDEILSLTWDMIDLENRTYTIPYEINKVKKKYDL